MVRQRPRGHVLGGEDGTPNSDSQTCNTEKAHIFTPAASFYRKKTLKESRWLVQGHIGCSTKQKETETLVLTSPSPQLTKHD